MKSGIWLMDKVIRKSPNLKKKKFCYARNICGDLEEY